jgi:hypothetical protein
MTSLQTRSRLLTAALVLAVLPTFAHAEDDTVTKKEIPGGRQRIAPRPAQESSELRGVPAGDNGAMPPPSMHGFGPMSGNPLFIALPMKASN